jgi:membrane-associated progesterone receptor component
MECVKEWEMQFLEKYDVIGKLLKPGEEATIYNQNENENLNLNKDEEKVNTSEKKEL